MKSLSLLLAVPLMVAIDPSAPDPHAVPVTCTTTKGNFSLVINPSWAPLGAARFLLMVDSGFFSPRNAAYRTVPGFLVQFGIPWTPTKAWPDIQDDPGVGIQYPLFKRGMIAFAGYAPNTRGTEAFISYQDTANLGRSTWGQPFGIVTEGMSTLDNFYSGYGDLTSFGGSAPDPSTMYAQGCEYLLTQYPKLDYITGCHRTGREAQHAAPAAPAPQTPRPMPVCSAHYCGSALARQDQPSTAVCLCHHNCLVGGSSLPCCASFQQACPAEYALVHPPAKAAPSPNAKGKKAKKHTR